METKEVTDKISDDLKSGHLQASVDDIKNFVLYFLTLSCIFFISNLTTFTEWLNSFINPTYTGLIVGLLSYGAKRYLQDNTK